MPVKSAPAPEAEPEIRDEAADAQRAASVEADIAIALAKAIL